MSSLDRPLGGQVMVFDLGAERGRAADPSILARSRRNARTLVKAGSMRVTLVVLEAGGEIAEHEAGGPITVQPLEGRVRFTAEGRDHDLGPGDLLHAPPGVRHAVASPTGATFLLTLSRAVPQRPAEAPALGQAPADAPPAEGAPPAQQEEPSGEPPPAPPGT